MEANQIFYRTTALADTYTRGFPLALNPHYNYILVGLVIFIFPAIFLILLTKRLIQRRRNANQGSEQYGYNLEPWRQPEAPPPTYQQSSAGPMSNGPGAAMPPQPDMRYYANYQTGAQKGAGLGPQHSTQDYV